MSTPTVLLYQFSAERSKAVKLLCLPLKLRVREVRPEEYGLTLEELLNAAEPKEAGEPLGQEMMVMVDMKPSQMNQLLLSFRRKKVPPVALKAVATASNLKWTAYELQSQLSAEHEAMKQGKSAHEEGEAE